jgi:hypothetical protein
MGYTFAHVGAAIAMKVEDYYIQFFYDDRMKRKRADPLPTLILNNGPRSNSEVWEILDRQWENSGSSALLLELSTNPGPA